MTLNRYLKFGNGSGSAGAKMEMSINLESRVFKCQVP